MKLLKSIVKPDSSDFKPLLSANLTATPSVSDFKPPLLEAFTEMVLFVLSPVIVIPLPFATEIALFWVVLIAVAKSLIAPCTVVDVTATVVSELMAEEDTLSAVKDAVSTDTLPLD